VTFACLPAGGKYDRIGVLFVVKREIVVEVLKGFGVFWYNWE